SECASSTSHDSAEPSRLASRIPSSRRPLKPSPLASCRLPRRCETVEMATLSLREHELTFGVPLTIEQRDQLAKVVAVRPSEGREQTYDLTPGSTIGALRLGDLDVVIQPKVPMDRVFFLL